MRNNVLISIIISTFNKPWSILSTTLESVISSDFRDFEIILIDQNRNSNIKSAIGENYKFKQITYLQSSEIGLSRGRNLGIKHAQGKWILFFDDDAILPGNTLRRISPVLIHNINHSLILYGTVFILETNKPYLKKTAFSGNKLGLLNFDSVCSIALMFNQKVFEEVGLFDEKLGAGVTLGSGEEADIILRTLKKGLAIQHLDGFEVYHPAPILSDLSKRISYGMGTGALYKKHLCSSLHFFVILGPKLLVMMLLRIFLIIINFHSAESRNFHLFFLRGCTKGFIQYRDSSKNKNNT
jgi:glycosyltransferase involved in cell wall biosynthesis